MIKRFLLLINSIILAFMFLGCGGGTDPAPEGAEITFSEGDIAVSDGNATTWQTEYVSIFVKNEEGLPLNNVELTITYPWAAPSTDFVVQFYDGLGKVDSPLTASTNEYGAYTLKFEYMSGSIEYGGDISVVSGSAAASIEFKVSVPTS